MQRIDTRTVFAAGAVLGLGLLLSVLSACGPSDPVAKLAEQRSQYRASLNSMTVREEPLEMPAEMPEGEEGAEADAAAEAAADEGAMEIEEVAPVPVRQIVMLDILVQSDSYEQLPGITLDVSMVDAGQSPKGDWKIWVETSTLSKGGTMSVTHEIEDVDYVEGDGFYVEVRHPIPEGERGDYRELSVAP